MKNLYTLLISLIALTAFSQAPQLINYQGIARSPNGNPIINTALALRFEILQGSASGTAVFTEDQAGVLANDLGVFSTQIGKTTALPTSWANGPYFLKVSIDTLNTTAFAVAGTPQQLASVPFALSAPAPTLSYGGGVLTVGDKTVNVTASGSTQTLSITNNSLSISGGNTVILPTTTLTTSGGGITVTPTGNNSFNLNVPSANSGSVSIREFNNPLPLPSPQGLLGILQISNPSPNIYSLAVAPDISYNQTSGELVLTNKPGLSGLGFSSSYYQSFYVTPNLVLTNGTLTSGPSNNAVNLNPLTPWRVVSLTSNSVACASTSYSYGIGTLSPNTSLHVDGFTRLGVTAPAMQVMTFTGTTGSSSGSVVNLPLPSYVLQNGLPVSITPAKIISVNVLVNTAGSDWVPAGHLVAPANSLYYWHLSGNNVVITNGATSSNINSQTVKVTITYTE